MFKKFKIKKLKPSQYPIVGNRPKVQKLPSQKSPTSSINESSQRLIKQYNTSKIRDAFGVGMDKRFYTKPPVVSVAKERIEKFGKLIESRSLERISKIRKAAGKRILSRKLEYGPKANVYKPGISSKNPNVAARFPKLKSIKRTKFGKSVQEKVTTLSLQAERLAKRKSEKAMKKFEQRLDIGRKRFFEKKTEYKPQLSKDESRALGFAPSQSADAKYFNLKSSFTPKEKIIYKSQKSAQDYKFNISMKKSNPKSKTFFYDSSSGKLKSRKKK
jgi:hypothetical protein